MKLIELERCEPSWPRLSDCFRGKVIDCLCEVALEVKRGGVSGG